MGLSSWFELAMDARFRELSNFATPPRAGRITAIEMSGQVRVDCDDPDGGDVLAWPLDGFTYAVDDVVYLAFAVNNPDSAIVLGSKSGEPSGGPYIRKDGTVGLSAEWDIGEDMAIRAERLEARDNEGLRIEDDGGNVGVFIEDATGYVGINTVLPGVITPSFTYNTTQASLIQSGGRQYGRFVVRGSVNAGFEMVDTGAAANEKWGSWISEDGRTRFLALADDGSIGIDHILALLHGSGFVGVGVASPQGKLHVHDGNAGCALITKTGVTNTAQTIIPNAAGDVVRAVTGTIVLSDGTNSVTTHGLDLRQGGTTTLDLSAGGSTWRTTLNANGSLTVARTSGTGTATISYFLHWM